LNGAVFTFKKSLDVALNYIGENSPMANIIRKNINEIKLKTRQRENMH
jgi:hypothetical protein